MMNSPSISSTLEYDSNKERKERRKKDSHDCFKSLAIKSAEVNQQKYLEFEVNQISLLIL